MCASRWRWMRSGAAPVAGSRLGEGEEELDVDVTVAPSGE